MKKNIGISLIVIGIVLIFRHLLASATKNKQEPENQENTNPVNEITKTAAGYALYYANNKEKPEYQQYIQSLEDRGKDRGLSLLQELAADNVWFQRNNITDNQQYTEAQYNEALYIIMSKPYPQWTIQN